VILPRPQLSAGGGSAFRAEKAAASFRSPLDKLRIGSGRAGILLRSWFDKLTTNGAARLPRVSAPAADTLPAGRQAQSLRLRGRAMRRRNRSRWDALSLTIGVTGAAVGKNDMRC